MIRWHFEQALLLYDQSRLRSEEVLAASQILREILAKIPVHVNWTYCKVSGTEPCTRDVRRPSVILHIVSQARRGTRGIRSGDIAITQLGPGTHMTVFTDRTYSVAQQLGLLHGLLLGYAIVHEVGHFLLSYTGHGASGIMQAQWGPEDYQSMLRRWLTFGPGELRRIRRNLNLPASTCRSSREHAATP